MAGQQSYAPIGVSPDWFLCRKSQRTEEPDEGNLQVRVCGEGAGQPVPLPGKGRSASLRAPEPRR